MNAIKQAVTASVDTYRTPYARNAKDHPRMCIFVGTTNQDHYLGDITGARRFWPLHCGKIDLEGIVENRDQFFAEAVQLFNKGEQWYQVPEVETLAEQEKRRVCDEWEDVIHDWLITYEANSGGGECKIRLIEVWTEALKGELPRCDRRVQIRIANSMRVLGWNKVDGWLHGKKSKYWEKIGKGNGSV